MEDTLNWFYVSYFLILILVGNFSGTKGVAVLSLILAAIPILCILAHPSHWQKVLGADLNFVFILAGIWGLWYLKKYS